MDLYPELLKRAGFISLTVTLKQDFPNDPKRKPEVVRKTIPVAARNIVTVIPVPKPEADNSPAQISTVKTNDGLAFQAEESVQQVLEMIAEVMSGD